jgi:hypothetical protein
VIQAPVSLESASLPLLGLLHSGPCLGFSAIARDASSLVLEPRLTAANSA